MAKGVADFARDIHGLALKDILLRRIVAVDAQPCGLLRGIERAPAACALKKYIELTNWRKSADATDSVDLIE